MTLVTGLDHVTIHTSKPDETIQFYQDLLGLENRPDDRPDFGFPGAWLWAGDRAVLHLVFTEADPVPKHPVVDHIAFSADDFDALCAGLEARDIKHRMGGNETLGLRQAFLKDPNGVRLEITARSTE